jgi:hypothetical protein
MCGFGRDESRWCECGCGRTDGVARSGAHGPDTDSISNWEGDRAGVRVLVRWGRGPFPLERGACAERRIRRASVFRLCREKCVSKNSLMMLKGKARGETGSLKVGMVVQLFPLKDSRLSFRSRRYLRIFRCIFKLRVNPDVVQRVLPVRTTMEEVRPEESR